MAQHTLRNVIVGDDALTQGTNGDDVARRTADHATCLLADGQHAVRIPIHSHDGRLAQHDALALDIYQHVGRAEVNTDIH